MVTDSSLFDSPRVQAYLNMGSEWHIDAQGGFRALARLASSDWGDLAAQRREATAPQLLYNGMATPLTAAQQSGGVQDGSILRLNLSGAMLAEGDLCTHGMSHFAEAIEWADNTPEVAGTLIKANTPGGEALAGMILYNAIKYAQKPVVVVANALHSAGVYGTLPAKEIIATGPAASIGSIGVYYSLNKEMIEWYKANVMDIYADESDDKNAAFRALLTGDPSGYKAQASQAARQFQALVKKHRPLGADADSTLRGGVFGGNDAKRRGLVDTVSGDMAYAIRRVHFYANQKKT